MTVVFMLKGERWLGTLVSASAKTVWVRLRHGDVLKRHRVKHAVGEVSP